MYTREYWHNENGFSFHYLKYMPENMEPGKKYPLVVFLNGYGEVGNPDGSEVDLVAAHGYFKYIAQGQNYPFILVGPQCPRGSYWGSCIESLNSFLDMVLETLPADPDRVSLTGLSMGGTGTWLWALANAERFASVAPVCGSGVPWYGFRLAESNVWAFHGDCDTTVRPEEGMQMVSAINRRGGNARLTIYPGVGHDSWVNAYTDPELVKWFAENRRPAQK